MTVANSSKIVYHSEIEGDKEQGQDSIIHSAYVAMGRPATVKMIQKYLKGIGRELDINCVSRSVNNLHSGKKKPAKILFVKEDKCEVTGRTANYYESILKLGQQVKMNF